MSTDLDVEQPSLATTAAKPWYLSITIWGGLLAAVSPLVSWIGYEIDISVAAALAVNAATLVGGLLAIIGRVKAHQPIRRRAAFNQHKNP